MSFFIKNSTIALGGSIFFFASIIVLLLFFVPPTGEVKYPQTLIVEEGESIRSVAETLEKQGLINSQTLFILANYYYGGKILSGSYRFSEPRGVLRRARELYFGERNVPIKRIRIPERSNLYDIADIFEENFENFDTESFLEQAVSVHGYLYPDTYAFPETEVTPEFIIHVMQETFEKRVRRYFDAYNGPLTEQEILSLAAVVDLEASRTEVRRKVAGVLFNRLELNIPLQVDVAFLFINGKSTFDLTREDLNSDDPLNTYRYAGIPPIPITNPSLDSIEAVLYPIEHDFLYFLADSKGITYFSETYEQHLSKKYTYIDSVRGRTRAQITDVAEIAETEEHVVEGEQLDETSSDISLEEASAIIAPTLDFFREGEELEGASENTGGEGSESISEVRQ